MDRVYVSGRLTNELQLKQLRDYLWVVTGAEEFYKKKKPHMTLVPGFTVKDGRMDRVRNIIDNHRFRNRKIQVNRISVYENIHKPYVVQLDIEHGFHDELEHMIDQLDRHAKTSINYPNSPHITLYKTKGYWDTIPRDRKKRLQEEIMSGVGIRDTQISRVKIRTIE
ncbi:MAG: hypothetical protein J07AB43_01820 [Candidatus Nanosalina sp. J07AB43]|jgi:hypothetical protein|nr:MAG: hypothetical protein J07AB43_01820 [Candidatus Nanosalina sp. J07AB43]